FVGAERSCTEQIFLQLVFSHIFVNILKTEHIERKYRTVCTFVYIIHFFSEPFLTFSCTIFKVHLHIALDFSFWSLYFHGFRFIFKFYCQPAAVKVMHTRYTARLFFLFRWKTEQHSMNKRHRRRLAGFV